VIIENFQREVEDHEPGQLWAILTLVVGQRSLTLPLILKIQLSAPGNIFGWLKVLFYYVDASFKVSWRYLN